MDLPTANSIAGELIGGAPTEGDLREPERENIGDRFTLSGCEHCNVHQRFDAIILWTSNHRAPVCMPRQDCWSIGSFEYTLKRGDVLCEGGEGNPEHRLPEGPFFAAGEWSCSALQEPSATRHEPTRSWRSERMRSLGGPVRRQKLFHGGGNFDDVRLESEVPGIQNSTRASGISFRNASAPAGMKNGSFLP